MDTVLVTLTMSWGWALPSWVSLSQCLPQHRVWGCVKWALRWGYFSGERNSFTLLCSLLFSFSFFHLYLSHTILGRMWGLDYKESDVLKNWCFWTVVLEKTLESPLDCKEIQPVHPKGDQSWIFIGVTNAEAETPILWPPDVKKWPFGKVPDAGKD